MAFRPDTKYYIGSKEYDTIYEAFDAVRTMAKGTVIKDKNGTTVFTKDIPITFISLTSIMESRQIRTIPLERCFLALPTTAMERC